MLATTLILSKHNVGKQNSHFTLFWSPVAWILDVGIELKTRDQALIHGGEVIAENLQDGKHNVETEDNEIIT